MFGGVIIIPNLLKTGYFAYFTPSLWKNFLTKYIATMRSYMIRYEPEFMMKFLFPIPNSLNLSLIGVVYLKVKCLA
jgi:hypothetical protein